MNDFEYEQRLEPKFQLEEKDGKYIRRKNFFALAEELMPAEAKGKWYAVYKIKKAFPIDGETLEVGTYLREQIFLPHQLRGGGIVCLGHHHSLIQEGIAKQYLEFIGVEKETNEL